MAINEKSIIEAAESLISEGINPSMQAVRDRIGGGSFATISPILRKWKASKETQTMAIIDMPVDMKAAVTRAGAELWRVASALATQQLEALRTESQERIDSANGERDETIAEIERLEAKNRDLDEKLAHSILDVREASASLQKEKNETTKLSTRLEDYEKQMEELKQQFKDKDHQMQKLQNELISLAKEMANLAKAADAKKKS